MYNFRIHSSVDGHLGCFNVLAIVNSAAMNNGIHMFFQFWFPQGICLGVGFLGHAAAAAKSLQSCPTLCDP